MKRLLLATALVLVPLAAYAQGSISDETKKQALEAIERYVKQDVALKDGFLIADPRTGKPLRLEFDYVHQGVKPHEDGYLACVDFKDASGTVYDVDVVVSRSGATMAVEEVFVHKIDGKIPDKKPSGAR